MPQKIVHRAVSAELEITAVGIASQNTLAFECPADGDTLTGESFDVATGVLDSGTGR